MIAKKERMTDMLRVIPKEPHPHVIEKLEGWLAAARLGKMDGLVLVGEMSDGKVRYTYAGKLSGRAIGGLAFVQHWLMHKLEKDDAAWIDRI